MGILSAIGVLRTCIKAVVKWPQSVSKKPSSFFKTHLLKEKLFLNNVFSVLHAQYSPQRI